MREIDISILGSETPGYTPRAFSDLSTLALRYLALATLEIHSIDRSDLEALAEMVGLKTGGNLC